MQTVNNNMQTITFTDFSPVYKNKGNHEYFLTWNRILKQNQLFPYYSQTLYNLWVQNQNKNKGKL